MGNYNLTDPTSQSTTGKDGYLEANIFLSVITLISVFGMFGNGMVIWLLGFCIKRNPFTSFILNLAIADFGVLTAIVVITGLFLVWSENLLSILYPLSICMSAATFSASQYTLTIISVDRCVSVFFPLWHRCHRPTHLSTIVCVIIWAISLLPVAINPIHDGTTILVLQLLVNASLCLPFMTISSLMLFFKVCCKPKQQRKQKTLITVLLTVFVFLFLSFPVNLFIIIDNSYIGNIFFFIEPIYYALFGALLNCSVNPLIYYLVGRPKKGRSKKSMKHVLQKLFKEEEIQVHVLEKPAETPL